MQSRRLLACRCGRQYYSHEHANHSQCQQQLYRSPPAGLLAVTSLGSRDTPPSLEPCLACWRRAVLKPMCAQSSSTCKAGDADLAHKTTYKTAARGRAQASTPQGWRQAPCSRTRPVLQWVPHGFRNGSRAALGGQAGPDLLTLSRRVRALRSPMRVWLQHITMPPTRCQACLRAHPCQPRSQYAGHPSVSAPTAPAASAGNPNCLPPCCPTNNAQSKLPAPRPRPD